MTLTLTLNGGCAVLQKRCFYGAHQKNLNEHRPVLSAAKCRPMILVSRNIRYGVCTYSLDFLGEGRQTTVELSRRQFLPRDASAERGYEIACRPSVRLSETFRYRVQIGLNSSKIISRPNSLGSLLSLTPTGAVWCKGNTPKMGVEYGRGQMKLIKATILLAS